MQFVYHYLGLVKIGVFQNELSALSLHNYLNRFLVVQMTFEKHEIVRLVTRLGERESVIDQVF